MFYPKINNGIYDVNDVEDHAHLPIRDNCQEEKRTKLDCVDKVAPLLLVTRTMPSLSLLLEEGTGGQKI